MMLRFVCGVLSCNKVSGLIYFFCNHPFTPYVSHVVQLSWAICQVMIEHMYNPHTNKTV